MKILQYNVRNYDFFTSVVIGSGLNEAITDYIAYECTKQYILTNNFQDIYSIRYLQKTNVKSAYDTIVNIFYTICKNTDMKTCLHYYFNADLDGLIEYINKKFHLEDNDKFVSIIYKMDTFIDILQSASFKNGQQDLKQVEYEMYKDTIDILLNKYIKEGQDISNLKFEDLIKDYRLPYNKQEIEVYFSPIKDYFNLKVATKLFSDTHLDINEESYQMSRLMINSIYNYDCEISEKFIKNEFFAKMFSRDMIISCNSNKSFNKQVEQVQLQAFKNIFSSGKYIANVNKRYDILTYLLQNKKVLSFDILNCFDGEFISKIINNNPKYLDVLLNEDYNKTVNSFYLLNDDVKLSQDFVSKIKISALKMYNDNLPYMHLITEYYNSMPLNIRADKMFSGDLCVFLLNNFGFDKDSYNEINDFLAQVKQNEKIFKDSITQTF